MEYLSNGAAEMKFRGGGLRNKSRKMLLDFLSLNSLQKMETFFKGKKQVITFLCLHNIFEDEETKLIELLNVLGRFYKFLSYSEAVKKIHSNSIDDAYLVISVDDGYKNNLRGAEIMKEFGVSSCFFLCTEIIGINKFEEVARMNAEKFNNPPIEFLNWKEVEKIQALGHEIGNHTHVHPNLGRMSYESVLEDVLKAKEELVSHCGSIVHFAWPYGRWQHFSTAAKQAVFDCGHISIASAERGSHINTANKKKSEYCIRREPVHLSWPMKHILYFLLKGVSHARVENNFFPTQI